MESAASRDARRWLQLVLGALWVVDGLLQYQPFMFTPGFARSLVATAQGNPHAIAASITWAAGIVAAHPVATNAAFATIQVLLGVGIAWRPTLKVALAGSIVWSVAVWWFGEGLGSVLTGSANPLSGAPGAVILYALLAVLLWPTHRPEQSDPAWSFVAARPVGPQVARLLWLVLWGALAYFAVQPGYRTPQGLHDMLSGTAQGQPRWLASIGQHAAGLVAGRGGTVSIIIAVVLGVIALGVFVPVPIVRVVLVVAVVAAAVIWVVGEAFGGVFTGQGTDPNTGPLLALLAAAYWPLPARTGR
ncbi:MAG: hypothetical protein JO272_16795 [Pseudonocardiales bacterium]|nr:hypothetical protein [Pseudonocardiales bacterium]